MNAPAPSLPDLAARINERHQAASTAARSAVLCAREAGELLLQAKAAVGHGNWLAWLREHTEVSERTAQVYMRLARHLDQLGPEKSAAVADLTLRDALAAITRDTGRVAALPAPAADQALSAAAQGERLRVTASRAQVAETVMNSPASEWTRVSVSGYVAALDPTHEGLLYAILGTVAEYADEHPEVGRQAVLDALEGARCGLAGDLEMWPIPEWVRSG